MTYPSSQDPLIGLWQTAPKPDPHHLLEDLQRLKRLHRRHNQVLWAIVSGIALLFIFEEATGRIATHGVLSALWTVGLVIGATWRRRARCNRLDALTLDTVSLLKTMIARAKSDLLVARCLYAGVPGGALVGFFVAKLAGIGAPPGANAAHPHLFIVQTVAGITALVIMVVAGAIMARSRRLQVQELSEKLRSMEAEL